MVNVRTRAKYLSIPALAVVAAALSGCQTRGFNEGGSSELRLPASAPLGLRDASKKNVANTANSNVDNTQQEVVQLGNNTSVSGKDLGKPAELYLDKDLLIVDEDALKEEENEPNDDELALQEDSAMSPEELATLVPDTSFKIEGNFPLCDGSIFLKEWMRDFDARWYAENSKKYSKKSRERKALSEARSQAFMTLMFPALGSLEFDYPAVITEDVLKWMEYFQTRGRSVFVTWLRRAEDVTPQMLKVLESYGLPKDLVYLAMIESGFNNRAMSVARAAGPWQFMRATGRLYGLRIDDYVDERRDPERATHAAAAYLTTLYTMFGDWHLASASYNAGEGRVYKAMRGQDQIDFFSLSENKRLPNETRNYVPKIIAAMIIGKNPLRFGFDVTDGSRALKTKKLAVERPIVLADLAKATGVDLKVLENLNPELRLGITPPPTKDRPLYALRVPESQFDKAEVALASLPPAPSYRRVVTRAPRKESVKNLTARFGLNLSEFLKANPGLKSSTRLRRGQVVSVPVKLGTGQFEKFSADREPSKKKRSKKNRGRKIRRTSTAAVEKTATASRKR